MIGERIGNFRIVAQLGMGGMGEVFLAEHEKIGTKVAIKMLQPHISANTEHVQRFFNEAIAASKIQHAGIGKIFDVGFHEQGRAYLVMEFLDGETLAARIRRLGRLPLEQTSDIGKQITSVLEAVHKAGITHRDLKPDNIFLIPDQELASGERVKVLDFGIAKLSGHSGGLTATAAGSMGTPAYMSPEQWKNSKNVDWRADAYSLGCVAFEMVAGRPPFMAETIGEACAKHLTEEPPRLSSVVSTPAALDDLIASLLAKQPEQRPRTMRDIGNAFAALATVNQLGLAATLPPPSSYSAGMSAPIPMLVPRTEAVQAHAPNTTLGAAAASAPVGKPAKNRTLLFVLLVAIGGLGLIGAMVALVMSSMEDTKAAAVAAREEVAREQARAVEEALAGAKRRDEVVAIPIVTPGGPVEAPIPGPAALGAEEIQAMAARHAAATTACFRRAEKGADAVPLASAGKVSVTLSVAASGSVSSVQLPDDLKSKSLGKCLEAMVREWKFRASPGGTFRFTVAKPLIDQPVARPGEKPPAVTDEMVDSAFRRAQRLYSDYKLEHGGRLESEYTALLAFMYATKPAAERLAKIEAFIAKLANTRARGSSTGDEPAAKPSPPICDEVSCILQGSLDSYPKGHCCAKFKKQKPAVPVEAETSNAASGLPEALDRSMISAGIAAVKGRVAGCGDKSAAKGQVKVSLKVNPDGSVASVTVKTTPDPALGSCVAAAVQRARFARTQSGGSFTFPFMF